VLPGARGGSGSSLLWKPLVTAELWGGGGIVVGWGYNHWFDRVV